MIPNPEMIPKLIPKWSPFLFLSTPKWSPRNYGMVIKHGTVDYFFFLCRNAAILSFLVSNKRKLVVGSLSCSSLAPVSFQLTFDPFSLMQCFEPRGFKFFFCAMFYKALFREMMISLLIQSQDYRRIHLRDFRIPCNVTKTRFCL